MKDKNIRIILAEANQPERHSNMLAERTGAKVVQLTGSVGMLPNTDDYIALFDANDAVAARAAFERALRIDEAVYGPDHTKVAIRVNNLGGVLRDLGDLAGARAALERALKINEAVYGPDHPTVAIRVNNLGSVLQDLGDLARRWADGALVDVRELRQPGGVDLARRS